MVNDGGVIMVSYLGSVEFVCEVICMFDFYSFIDCEDWFCLFKYVWLLVWCVGVLLVEVVV